MPKMLDFIYSKIKNVVRFLEKKKVERHCIGVAPGEFSDGKCCLGLSPEECAKVPKIVGTK